MQQKIYLAGGCFWGVQAYFDKIKGVIRTSTGYANGKKDVASYAQLSLTLHAETVEIIYNPEIVGLSFLLSMYFKIINPSSKNHQGGDYGTQYRTGIYYCDEKDLPMIRQAIAELKERIKQSIAIEVEPLRHYILAEEIHQKYLELHPNGYCHIQPALYAEASTVEPIPEPSWRLEDLTTRLTALQHEVTQKEGTEPPYQNAYWDFYEDGIYVDIVTGEPLFSSTDKFPCSGGWASFSKPISNDILLETTDTSNYMVRTEVKSKQGLTHLGHVFPDGPKELTGLRYCINSASLEFIPKEDLARRGFSKYLYLFE